MDEDRKRDDMAGRTADDAALWESLASMWDDVDPMPEALVERVLVTLATRDLDAEYELLQLVERTDRLAGARSSAEALTISFSGASFTLLLRVGGIGTAFRRVDGWVSPAREMRVSVKQDDRTWAADVDSSGRFELPRLPGGPSRFWLVGRAGPSTGADEELFATPTFDL